MLKLRHNLRWQASAFFLYVWYTICVDGMACDILSKDTSWNDEQGAPPDDSHHHSRKKKVLLLWAFYDNLTQKHQ